MSRAQLKELNLLDISDLKLKMTRIVYLLVLMAVAHAGYISNLDRAVQLLQTDLVITTTRVTFVPASK